MAEAKTPAERNRAYRQRQAEKMARYEAALREIVNIESVALDDPRAPILLISARSTARQALNGSADKS